MPRLEAAARTIVPYSNTQKSHTVFFNNRLKYLLILGFDNAHPISIKLGGRYSGRIMKYDHMHKTIQDKGTPYEFVSAQQLLSDFFIEVNIILNEINKRGASK